MHCLKVCALHFRSNPLYWLQRTLEAIDIGGKYGSYWGQHALIFMTKVGGAVDAFLHSEIVTSMMSSLRFHGENMVAASKQSCKLLFNRLLWLVAENSNWVSPVLEKNFPGGDRLTVFADATNLYTHVPIFTKGHEFLGSFPMSETSGLLACAQACWERTQRARLACSAILSARFGLGPRCKVCHSFVWYSPSHRSSNLASKCFAISAPSWTPSFESHVYSGRFSSLIHGGFLIESFEDIVQEVDTLGKMHRPGKAVHTAATVAVVPDHSVQAQAPTDLALPGQDEANTRTAERVAEGGEENKNIPVDRFPSASPATSGTPAAGDVQNINHDDNTRDTVITGSKDSSSTHIEDSSAPTRVSVEEQAGGSSDAHGTHAKQASVDGDLHSQPAEQLDRLPSSSHNLHSGQSAAALASPSPAVAPQEQAQENAPVLESSPPSPPATEDTPDNPLPDGKRMGTEASPPDKHPRPSAPPHETEPPPEPPPHLAHHPAPAAPADAGPTPALPSSGGAPAPWPASPTGAASPAADAAAAGLEAPAQAAAPASGRELVHGRSGGEAPAHAGGDS
jgi:hypothetical protein